jgi:hypothetical protein
MSLSVRTTFIYTPILLIFALSSLNDRVPFRVTCNRKHIVLKFDNESCPGGPFLEYARLKRLIGIMRDFSLATSEPSARLRERRMKERKSVSDA